MTCISVDICIQKLDLQQRIMTDVLLMLLGDEDHRVRHAAAAAFCRYFCKFFAVYVNDVSALSVSLSFTWLLDFPSKLSQCFDTVGWVLPGGTSTLCSTCFTP